MNTVAVVGCGGIGWHLVEPVARTLNTLLSYESTEFFLVDGDTVEAGNMERQYFQKAVGRGKADVLRERLLAMFPSLPVTAVNFFVNGLNIQVHRDIWLKPGCTILVAVDNNATRAFLDQTISGMKDTVLIMGGNDETAGQAQMCYRKNGTAWPRISEFCPEIRMTDGKMPGMGTCMRTSTLQSALANRGAALCMEILWRNSMLYPAMPKINEIRFNVDTALMRGFWQESQVKRGKKEEKDPWTTT